jgi:hypothetical protein
MRPQPAVLSSKPVSFSRPLPHRFLGNVSGGASVQAAMLFGAAGIALALLGAPVMQAAATRFADSGGPGVDRTTTGSVSPVNRYTVRRSVLHGGDELICGGTGNCLKQ